MDEGSFRVIARKEVVEEVFDDRDEVDLSTALVKIQLMKLVISMKKMLLLRLWTSRRTSS